MEVLKALARRLAPAIVDAMPSYQAVTYPRARWRPREVRGNEPWIAHLEAYSWGQDDAQAVENRFRALILNWADPDQLIGAAQHVAGWGFPNQVHELNAEVVAQVVRTARALARGQIPGDPGPWTAKWTKIACAATIEFDEVPAAPGITPQAICDSRTTTAICDLMDGSAATQRDVQCARSFLFIPPPQKVGIRRRPLAMTARWRAGWGRVTAATTPVQLWISQALGSLIVHEVAIELNRRRIGCGQWTSFQVGLALFVFGY